ncbi:MAG: prolyl aminopeptidase [Hahellaceae bacterium]|jgi:proline iminopeptidase|nr:prolyl aminopeptidase [Hahellaceae bacterium]
MQALFPEIKPYRETSLTRGLHRVHVERLGNPEGIPLLILHDGPGAAIDPIQARLVDAERFHIIQFDQRGCGRSQPLAETRENTLNDLLDDIEAIRAEVGVDRWMVYGHGWGATLALAYGLKCPERVTGMVMSGLFLGRAQDIRWAFGEGASQFFPDAWKEFMSQAHSHKPEEVLADYAARLQSANELQQIQAAKQWARWEVAIQGVHPNQDLAERLQHPHVAISLAKLSCHYLQHQCFLEQTPLLTRLSALAEVSATLVHGRFDVQSPLKGAYEVHSRWPGSQLYIVRDGGHSLRDPAMTDAVMRALIAMSEKVAGDDVPAAE